MENEINQDSTTQVSWNLSQMLLIEIAKYLDTAGTCFIELNYKQGFRALLAIKDRIIYYLNEEERKELGTKENSILKTLALINPPYVVTQNWGEEQFKSSRIVESNTINQVRKYNNSIMECLGKYGFLIKPAEDSKKMF